MALSFGVRTKPGSLDRIRFIHVRDTEITAVCVHPPHRGRGFGQMLLGAITRQITARSEIPFLHVFANNTSAIACFSAAGMQIRRRLHVTVLQKQT